jgi:enamine deaminase RidA (YjgF/YER057c/UK114 family)
MGNAFDSANYPTREPETLVVGDRWMWKRTDLGADYPPASYTLKYSLRLGAATTAEIEIAAATSGSDYLVEVASATTAGYTAGLYVWQAYITRTSDTQRVLVDSGTITVVVNRDVSTADPRSHARKVLASIEAVLESRATRDQEEYSIAGRSLKRTPIPDLIVLKDKYTTAVSNEIAAERIAKGLGDPRRIGVRLRRV